MPALSILNADPPLLAGPDLLHNLVDWTSAAASPALDYLGPEGTSARYSYTCTRLSFPLADEATLTPQGTLTPAPAAAPS
ncbi:hypothetical protein V496_05229 [Pseudogymnoascus sp. VKM F-4515 (FW-2607)]|nr:hypothetical protein V496_05229 [Pseudogymnoascus sp. VKM F-4515 (FW-2607)]